MEIKQYIENSKTVKLRGLRKVRTKNMVEALASGRYESSNHRIRFENNLFIFYYRGTCIYTWHALADIHKHVYAGEFETTRATANQRHEIYKAIKLFKEAVKSA